MLKTTQIFINATQLCKELIKSRKFSISKKIFEIYK